MERSIWIPGDTVPPDYVMAKDDLPARDQGTWAQDKLRWLEEYLKPAIAATRRKRRQTYYLDLFAGPGRNANADGDDFPGSPLVALEAQFLFRDADEPTGFEHFLFCNIAALDHYLLQERMRNKLADVGGRVDPRMVHCRLGDSNQLIHDILAQIPEWAYVMAVADIEGPKDLAFDTLRALRSSHKSVDLYVLYPTNLGISRLLTYSDAKRRTYRAMLDRYFGTPVWWEIVSDRLSPAQSSQMRARLLDLYQKQLHTLWSNVSVARTVEKRGSSLYHMLFATDFEPAQNMAESARRRSGQYDLLDRLR